MTEERKHTCSVRDGKFVEPCHTLEQFLTAGGAYAVRGSGFFFMTLTHLPTNTESRSMVGYKTPQMPKGILVNFCPWCGTQIDAPFAEPAETPAKKGGSV